MPISEIRINEFFNLYFQPQTSSQSSADIQISTLTLMTKCGFDFKNFKGPSINCPKPIKQFGFMKKYDVILSSLPYVSASRAEQVDVELLTRLIEEVYSYYLSFVKKGMWKTTQYQSHLQEFTLLYLYEMFCNVQNKIKRKYGSFDRFLLNVFYTINILKSSSKLIRNFSNFLNSSYSFGELFLYICLKSISVQQGGEDMIDSQVLKKIIKIFQAQDSSNVSVSMSRDSIDGEEGKMVSVNNIFLQPIGGCLSVPKTKMYKIMKICKVIDSRDGDKGKVEWGDFLKNYFNMVEDEEEVCFQHVISAAVAKNTYELSRRLLSNQSQQKQQQFLEEAFTYVFEILELIFSDCELTLQDQKTLDNIESLRKHYQYMKILKEQNILVTNKFSQKILKNSYVLELYKKYIDK